MHKHAAICHQTSSQTSFSTCCRTTAKLCYGFVAADGPRTVNRMMQVLCSGTSGPETGSWWRRYCEVTKAGNVRCSGGDYVCLRAGEVQLCMRGWGLQQFGVKLQAVRLVCEARSWWGLENYCSWCSWFKPVKALYPAIFCYFSYYTHQLFHFVLIFPIIVRRINIERT